MRWHLRLRKEIEELFEVLIVPDVHQLTQKAPEDDGDPLRKRKWARANREAENERKRAWKLANPDKQRDYRRKNARKKEE